MTGEWFIRLVSVRFRVSCSVLARRQHILHPPPCVGLGCISFSLTYRAAPLVSVKPFARRLTNRYKKSYSDSTMKPKNKLVSDRAAFRTGFLNGLGAPAMLFADFHCPTIKVYGADLSNLPANRIGGFAQDLNRIGGDFLTSIGRHGKSS